jgi:hypothetical protein
MISPVTKLSNRAADYKLFEHALWLEAGQRFLIIITIHEASAIYARKKIYANVILMYIQAVKY